MQLQSPSFQSRSLYEFNPHCFKLTTFLFSFFCLFIKTIKSKTLVITMQFASKLQQKMYPGLSSLGRACDCNFLQVGFCLSAPNCVCSACVEYISTRSTHRTARFDIPQISHRRVLSSILRVRSLYIFMRK